MGMIVIWLSVFFSLLSFLFCGIYLRTDNIIFKYIGLLFILSSLAFIPGTICIWCQTGLFSIKKIGGTQNSYITSQPIKISHGYQGVGCCEN